MIVLVLGRLTSAQTPEADDAWRSLAKVQFLEARQAFEKRLESDPADRLAKLGLASALLNIQPRIASDVERSAALLEEVVAAGGDDEAGIEAAYLLARIDQLHRTPANAERAISRYEALIARHPEHGLSQMGFIKLAILRLHGADETSASTLFVDLERRSAFLTDPSARRDFHLFMAGAAARLDLGDEASLRHLVEVDAIGLAKRKTAADVEVRISTLARRLGKIDIARNAEARFFAEFPRDSRTFTIRARAGGAIAEKETP